MRSHHFERLRVERGARQIDAPADGKRGAPRLDGSLLHYRARI